MQHWQRQHHYFLAVLLGIFILSGLLAVRYDRTWDLTQSQRNQLSETSITLMKQLQEPLTVTAFSRGNPKVKSLINRLLSRYQQHGDIRWQFKNPDSEIDTVRQYGISRDGELLLTYQGQTLRVEALNETAISRGIYALLQGKARQILFISGHGERMLSQTNTGYGTLQSRLQNHDINSLALDIQRSGKIPDNTDLLVIADPQYPYSDNVVTAIGNYLYQGGRLLWLGGVAQPALSRLLGVRVDKSKLLTTDGKDYGLDNPSYIPLIPDTIQRTPLLQSIDTMVVFPNASPVSVLPTTAGKQWHSQALLNLGGTLMLQTEQTIQPAVIPTVLGLALTPKNLKQRHALWIIGSADFAANDFIGLGQNADFAVALFQQLSTPDTLHIQLPDDMPPPVVLSEKKLAYLGLVFIVIIPLLLLLLGRRIRRGLSS